MKRVALRVRRQTSFLYDKEELCTFREAFRNLMDLRWGEGNMVSGNIGNCVAWVDCFEHAPEDYGYLFNDDEGCIREANDAGTDRLLDCERS